MIIASGNCTMTATGESLSFLKKEMYTFASHEVKIEYNRIDLTKPLFVGDVLVICDMHIKITTIDDKIIIGHTIQQGE
tara:strand:- start:164 stop:397 length:234 start_codon:yes stop_codon:yes gene_type:complete